MARPRGLDSFIYKDWRKSALASVDARLRVIGEVIGFSAVLSGCEYQLHPGVGLGCRFWRRLRLCGRLCRGGTGGKVPRRGPLGLRLAGVSFGALLLHLCGVKCEVLQSRVLDRVDHAESGLRRTDPQTALRFLVRTLHVIDLVQV